ncbi:MAG: hypothetical protein A2428_00665 [Bdellovibrionales bacterium RIFOXYC1_FULL_54_43]|nr:MAG: hypothetical protein A2428_00665 [Bdellovibrionales bacterium RIFOXYC1_FULL_54_43]OFZ85224.1 MAG: hypothetical protein A2603_08840 [Bdellovibrionales bacterium RIFOXYD1_FULL_55_31]
MFAGLLVVALTGCAHAPITKDADPRILLEQTCGPAAPGMSVTAASGTVWLKAKSKEASGQFPATVQVKSPDSLHLEVTNLLGASEAIIRIEGKKYTIESSGSKKAPRLQEQGYHSWGGIPLHFATDLFLGRIPCPGPEARREANSSVTAQGELVVRTRASLDREEEQFTYSYRPWAGNPWPEFLIWERKGTVPMAVHFKFDDPEEGTKSPRRWEATSSLGAGEIKVRWRDRDAVH